MKNSPAIKAILIAAILVLVFSCEKDTSKVIPSLTTAEVANITATTVTGGGNITSDGGAPITARGVCWSTTPNATVSDKKTSDGTGVGSFTSSITGLTPGTTYYVRAYATNSVGTAYGNQVMATTLSAMPTLSTSSLSAVTATSFTIKVNITNDGGAPIMARGVCWSMTPNPTVAGKKTTDGTGVGSFTSSIPGLTPGTTYYVRAYATNIVGVTYGDQITVTTLPILPKVNSSLPSVVTATTATMWVYITSDGGAPITARGVCWSSTTPNATVSDKKTSDGTGVGSFITTITGLTPRTTYYVRAYATNSAGTSYGSHVTVTTPIPSLTISTSSLSEVTETSAISGGNIESEGGSITERGVCWSTIPNPTVFPRKTSDGTGVGSFISSITGLTPGTTYYVRAYAVHGYGISYGNQVTATTLPVLPIIDFSGPSEVTATSVTMMVNITGEGKAPITARGVCWSSTNPNPTVADNQTSDGTGVGSFTSSIPGLTPKTTYYVRAYATNSYGTSYGNQVTVTTLPILPIIDSSGPPVVTETSITMMVNIKSEGGAPITTRGVCWSSTTPNPTVFDRKTLDGTGIGSFTSTITGLTPGTTYHVRAYATNSYGTSYGIRVSVTMPPS